LLSNTIIVKGVEEALFEATENFLNSQNWRDDYFKLKAFSFIFANALEELLKNERKIKSRNEEEIRKKFLSIISSELEKLNNNYEYRKDFENKLDDKLYIMHMKSRKISNSPHINFVYWALKNTSRLCMSPDGVNLSLQLVGYRWVLNSYFGIIFSTINTIKKKNLSLKVTYLSLLNSFVDEILNWNFYYN